MNPKSVHDAAGPVANVDRKTAAAVAATYVVLVGSGLIGWDLRSTALVGWASLLIVTLTVLLFSDVTKFIAKGAGWSIEAERQRLTSEQELPGLLAAATQPDEQIAQDAIVRPETIRVTSSVGEPTVAAKDTPEPKLSAGLVQAARRRVIERLMTEAAQWGWASQHLFKTPPVPHIVWTGNEPTILFGMGEQRAPREAALRSILAADIGSPPDDKEPTND